jgi:hypothetical protein
MDTSFQKYLDSLFPTIEQQEMVCRELYQVFGTGETREIGMEPIVHISGGPNSGKSLFSEILSLAFTDEGIHRYEFTRIAFEEMMHTKVNNKENFIDIIKKRKMNMRLWDWMVELYESNVDVTEVSLGLITKGPPRLLKYRYNAGYNDGLYFEYRSETNPKWTSTPPCECIALAAKNEIQNPLRALSVTCECTEFIRLHPIRRNPLPHMYYRRLVDANYLKGGEIDVVKVYPYFNHHRFGTEFSPETMVKDIVGVITVGSAPLSSPRVRNLELIQTFSMTDRTLDPNLRRRIPEYAVKLRKWVEGYNPLVKAAYPSMSRESSSSSI